MEYAYGKPSDVISNSGRSNSKSAPQITFNVSSPVEPTIDITPEDEQ